MQNAQAQENRRLFNLAPSETMLLGQTQKQAEQKRKLRRLMAENPDAFRRPPKVLIKITPMFLDEATHEGAF